MDTSDSDAQSHDTLIQQFIQALSPSTETNVSPLDAYHSLCFDFPQGKHDIFSYFV